MATVIVMLKKHYQKKDGSYPVVLQVNAQNKQKYLYTPHSVTPDQWDDLKWVKKNHRDHVFINQDIENRRRQVLDNINEMEASGKPLDLSRIGKPKEVKSFSSYLSKRLQYFIDKGNINMEYKVRADLREIEQINGGEVFYSDIDNSFLKKIEVYLKQIGNHQNTIARKFKNFRTHYNSAMHEDGAPAPNPFDKIKIKKEPVFRNKLNIDEVDNIEKLQLSGPIEVARDMFLFSLYAQGMRFENVLKLRKDQIQNGSIFYQMNKGKKFRAIGIHPKLEFIVNKYISTPGRYLFPCLIDKEYDSKEFYYKKGSENARINMLLKFVAEGAGIKSNLSFHIARHSFAWRYYTMKNGADIDVLKDAMGHSDMQVTQHYLKSLDDGYINDKVKDIF